MPTLRKHIATKEMKSAGISKAKMASVLGFNNREAFYKHFKKDDIDIDLFNRIINKLNEWKNSANKSNPKFDYNTLPANGKFFPVIAKCYAGEPNMIFQESNIHGYAFFKYPKEERCFAIQVIGDSMSGNNHKSIDDGDIVLVDMDAEILNGDVVLAVLKNGRELIKQYQSGERDKVSLVSFNPQYPHIELKEEDFVAIYRIMERNKTTKF